TLISWEATKNPELLARGLNFKRRLFVLFGVTITKRALLSITPVEPLANEVRDDVPDDGCSDGHEFSGKILVGQAAC
ncbi:MAG: hypothetical protein IKG61_02145, partial [Selenomonadaceae bacterium]|nr:hypothetical protein [Selenomonadaceae bacterium]